MCGGFRPIGRQGIPLSPDTLAGLPAEERAFWDTFLPMAMEEAKRAESNPEVTFPYEPSVKLKEMYHLALQKYAAEKYCQIQQLMPLFNWQ